MDCLELDLIVFLMLGATVLGIAYSFYRNESSRERKFLERSLPRNESSTGRAGVKCEVRGGKMRGTGARYQCEAMGNLQGWNVQGAANNWHSRRHYRM